MRLVELDVYTELSRNSVRVQAQPLHVISEGGQDHHRLSVDGLEFEVALRPTPRPFRPRMMRSSEFPSGKLEEESKPVPFSCPCRRPSSSICPVTVPASFCTRTVAPSVNGAVDRRSFRTSARSAAERLHEAQTERQLAEYDEHRFD